MPKMNDDYLFELAKKVVEEAKANAAANPTSDHIQIVVVEPNKKPYKKLIPNKLESMNEIVGGYIEIVNLGKTKSGARLAITLNEEGKLCDLPFNRRIVDFDILVGAFFITAYNLQGDNISLSNDECEKLIRQFTPIEIYI
jgi:hypothetical protein